LRPPAEAQIAAPEFPPKMDWLGVAFLRMDKLMGRNAVLIEFWDYARINSLRTLPYLIDWHHRYAGSGLRIIGVHAPGYSFGRDRELVESAVERLGVPYPVVLDPDLEIWKMYGNRGWPGRYLFDRTGLLRFMHYGEGEYLDTERAIQECVAELDPDAQLPEPLDPKRPEDAPGAMLAAQTADIVLPAQRERLELVRDWEDGGDFIQAADAGAAASFTFDAADAFAVLSGTDVDPGLYESDGTVVAESPGLRLHGVQFTPGPPPAPS
jgi:hypothetical protein